MKKQKTFRERFNETIFVRIDFYLKLSLTIFFIALFVLLFILKDGKIYFENNDYCAKFKNSPFQVHVIDVENGDAILIKLPNNKSMLIDTGSEKYYDDLASYIRQFNYYENKKEIDYLVLTHADSDHIGNAKNIIDKFNVRTLYRPKVYSKYEVDNMLNNENYQISDSLLYDNVIRSAYYNNCKIIYSEQGSVLLEGGCKIEFLSPKLDNYTKENDYSAVLKLIYDSKTFLFMGDAEESIESSLIEDYGDNLKADVLKIGHHGSITSTSQRFLNYVKPKYALISSSGKSEILPNYKVIDRLNENNIKILATGNIGSFAMSIKNGDIVYKGAEENSKTLVIIFSLFMLIIFILWFAPFKKLNFKAFKTNNK